VSFEPAAPDINDRFRIRIYQQRIPLRVVSQLMSGARGTLFRPTLPASLVCRKLLADRIRPLQKHQFGVSLDDENGSLELFFPDKDGELIFSRSIPRPEPALQHPLTGLQEDWLWGGEGSPHRVE
jgi:hypothetical protein